MKLIGQGGEQLQPQQSVLQNAGVLFSKQSAAGALQWRYVMLQRFSRQR